MHDKELPNQDLSSITRTEKVGEYDISTLLPASLKHHNFIRFGARGYGLENVTQPRDVVSHVGQLEKDTRLALVHMGYLITDSNSYEMWKKTQGRMREMMTGIDPHSVLFHGENENVQAILEKAKSYKVEPVPHFKASKVAAEHSNALYQNSRGFSGDNLYLITEAEAF